jgi:pimeloyl-ACP methyl ester carboxylesterase
MSPLQAVRAGDGTDVIVADEGSGRPVILLHGGSSDEGPWAPVAALLAPSFRVLRVRRRVYRLDLPSDPVTTFAEQVADVLTVASALAEPSVLVGHSSGAILALETVVRDPGPFSGLVVYEPPLVLDGPVGGPDGLPRARTAQAAGDLGAAMAIFVEHMVGMPHEAAQGVEAAVAQDPTFAAMVPRQLDDTDAIDRLGPRLAAYRRIDLPVLMLNGDQSPAHLGQRTAALAAVLTNGRRQTLTGQGHGAHQGDPVAVADAIAVFVDSLNDTSGR